MLKVRQGFLTLCSVLLISQGSAADSLKDIYELALQSDPTLRAARANFQVGRETENISRAYLLPVISASADFSQAERTVNHRKSIRLSQLILLSVKAFQILTQRPIVFH